MKHVRLALALLASAVIITGTMYVATAHADAAPGTTTTGQLQEPNG